MNHRIKLFIGFLAFTAVVSVFSFFDVFKAARSLVNEPANTPVSELDDDTDHDGLSNTDESYWNTDFQNPDSDGDGFLDGEEVASSRDPLEPGPNDKIINNNLTDKLANLALGGFAEGTLKTSSTDFESSINSLADSVIEGGIASFIPKQDISKIKIIESSIDADAAYLKQAGAIMQSFFIVLGEEGNAFESKIALIDDGGMANPEFVQFFSAERDKFEALADQWLRMTVPRDWFPEHQAFLDIIAGFAETNNALAGGKDDPVRATLGFNLFVRLIDSDLDAVLKMFSDKARQENLPLDI
jgi:hypothetical protein